MAGTEENVERLGRARAAAACLTAIPIGTALSAVVELAVLLAILVTLITLEQLSAPAERRLPRVAS